MAKSCWCGSYEAGERRRKWQKEKWDTEELQTGSVSHTRVSPLAVWRSPDESE
jgi:hypothetical protein